MKKQIKQELKLLYRKDKALAHQVAKVLGCKIVIAVSKKQLQEQAGIVGSFSLDRRQFSPEAYKEFKKVFKKLGYYLGDIEIDFYGKSQGDTFFPYITKKKLTKKQLKQTFSDLLGE
jgi:hypothetical protein